MRFRIHESESTIKWTHPITGEPLLTVRVDDVHPSLKTAVFRYGLKQIVADAGAMSKGARLADRIEGMRRRAAALRDGTWGTRMPAFPDADMFTALVECGALRDTTATRDAWRGLSSSQRRAAFAAAGEPARRALERIRPAAAPETGASVLAALMSASGAPTRPTVGDDDVVGDDEPIDRADDEPIDADDDAIDAAALGIDVPTADRAND